MDLASLGSKYYYGSETAAPVIQGYTPQPSLSSTFSLKNLGSSVVHGVEGIGKFAYHAAVDNWQGLNRNVNAIEGAGFQQTSLESQRQHLDQLSAENKKLQFSDPKAYVAGLKQLQSGYADLSRQASQIPGSLPSKGEVVRNIIGTAATPLAFGSFGLGGEAPGLTEAGANIAKNVLRAPVRQALEVTPTLQAAEATPGDIANKRYGNLATNAALFFGIPATLKYGAPLLAKAGEATFGTQGLLDEVFGPRIKQYIASHPGSEDVFKIMQQFTLNQPGVKGDLGKAAQKLRSHFVDELGVANPKTANLDDVLKQADSYYKEANRVNTSLAKQGAGNLVLTKNPAAFAGKVIYRVQQALRDDPEVLKNLTTRQQLMDSVLNDLNLKNKTLETALGKAIGSSSNIEGLKSRLADIKQLTTVDASKFGLRLKKGFALTYGPKETAYLPNAKEVGKTTLQLGKEATGIPGKIGSTLTKMGLSPRATDNAQIKQLVKNNFTDALKGQNYTQIPSAIFNELEKAAREAKGAFDVRSLTVSEVKNALGPDFTRSDAKLIRKAYADAYAKVPTSLVGAGPKALNLALSKVPGEAQYLRAQAIGRYESNPFFKVKQITKSALVELAQGGNPFKRVSQSTSAALERSGLFNAGRVDMGAYDFTGGPVSKQQVNVALKQIMGSFAEGISRSTGRSVEDLLRGSDATAKDFQAGIQNIVGYPKGGYLNSPLAKTLNLIVFPSRFEAKILGTAAKALGKMNPLAQGAILRDLANADQWVNSPQGQQWQKNNSELLGILKYFTPAGEIANLFTGLKMGKLGDVGEIGGLPVGVLSQMLQNQGVNLGPLGSPPYVDPKTGQLVPKKIPADTLSRVQQGLNDLVSSLFSYPGKQVGLPKSKGDVVSIIPGLKPGKTTNQSEGVPSASKSTIPQLNGTLPNVKRPTPVTVPSRTSTLKPPKAKRSKTVPKSQQLPPLG